MRYYLAKRMLKGMMAFLDNFPGIGPKYARNIMMDCYHPLFRNCIAIDARIKSVSKKLGLEFKGYEEQEYFYKIAAEKAGIEGWELDRLIWGYTNTSCQTSEAWKRLYCLLFHALKRNFSTYSPSTLFLISPASLAASALPSTLATASIASRYLTIWSR